MKRMFVVIFSMAFHGLCIQGMIKKNTEDTSTNTTQLTKVGNKEEPSSKGQFEPLLLEEDTEKSYIWSLPKKTIPSIDDPKIVPTCPAETEVEKNNLKIISEKLLHQAKYCLFKKKCDQGDTKCCQAEVEPVLFSYEKNVNTKTCGPSSNYEQHGIGFYFCGKEQTLSNIEKRSTHRNVKNEQTVVDIFRQYMEKRAYNYPKFFKLYDLCINVENSKVLYTRHQVMYPEMFLQSDKNRLQMELGEDAEISTDPFHFASGTFEKLKQKYITQNKAFDVVNANFMVPKEHISLRVWRKTITHYINVAPLWDKLQKLITAVNEGIKKIALEMYLKEKYFFQVFTTVQNKEKKNDDEFTKNIWYRLLYDSDTKSAILVIVDSAPELQSEVFNCERKIDCKMELWYEKKNSSDEGIPKDILKYGYCCYPSTSDVEKIFQTFVVKIEGRLNLDEYFQKIDES